MVGTNASAVQFPCCCKLDHKILLIALGTIHATAIQAPNTLNSKSVTVATATPNETTTRAATYICQIRSHHTYISKSASFLKLLCCIDCYLAKWYGLIEKNELCCNNGWSDSDFRHLVEADTAQELYEKGTFHSKSKQDVIKQRI